MCTLILFSFLPMKNCFSNNFVRNSCFKTILMQCCPQKLKDTTKYATTSKKNHLHDTSPEYRAKQCWSTHTKLKLHTIKTPANVKWCDTNTIPSCNETFITGVKKDKGEHSIQHVHKIFSIFFILSKTGS